MALNKAPDYSRVVNVLGRVFGVEVQQLYRRGPPGRAGANPARAVAMWLCQDYTGMTQPEIARIFGGLHYSAVAQTVRRIKSKVQSDHGLRGPLEAIRAEL